MAAASLVVRISAQLAEFQKSFDEANKTLNKFESEFSGVATKAAAVGAFIGTAAEKVLEKVAEAATHAIEALPNLIEHTIEVGNRLYEMSLKTGASVENLSKLRYVAGQTGIEFDSFNTTLFKMQQFLGSAGNKADEAQKHLNVLGLNLKNLKNEKPDQAFIDVISALEKIPNRADQAAAGAAIFGRGFKEMAGLAAENIHTLIGEAENLGLVMTTEMAAAAHVADDEFKALSMRLEAVGIRIGTAFLPAIIGLEQNIGQVFTSVIKDANTQLGKMGGSGGFLSTVAAAMGTGNGAIAAQVKLYEVLRDTMIGLIRNGVEPLVTGIAGIMQFFDAAKIVFEGAIGGMQRLTMWADKLAIAFLEVTKFTPGGVFVEGKINAAIQSLQADIERVNKSWLDGKVAIRENTNSMDFWSDAGKKAVAAIESGLTKLGATHTDVAKIIAEFAARSRGAYGGLSEAIDDNTEASKNANKAAEELHDAMMVIRSSILKVADAVETAWNKAVRELEEGMFAVVGDINKVNSAIASSFDSNELKDGVAAVRADIAFVARSFDLVAEKANKAAHGGIDEVARSLSQLAQVSGGAFGGLLKGLSEVVTSIDVAKKALDGLGAGFTKVLDFSKAGVAGTVSSLLALVGVAVQAGHSLGGLLGLKTGKLGALLGTNATGRSAVIDFAQSFGGFDALHKKLLDTFDPATAERFWISLTQGVGRANPKEAAAAIDAINQAFGIQADRVSKTQAVLDEYGITFEQTGEKFRNATLATAFDELFEKTQILKDAGVDYGLILEKQADQYSQLTARAIATGSEIPQSMRPILEQLRDMGLLTDKATGEFIDLGNVKWATTLTEGFKSVTDAINKLTDTITNGLGGALDTIGRKVIRPRIEVDMETTGGSVPAFASGGIVRRPTLALVGESGPEAIIPLSQMGKGSTQPIVIQTVLDGRIVAESIANVARRYGLA